jgi:hypothetical protein
MKNLWPPKFLLVGKSRFVKLARLADMDPGVVTSM